MSENKKVRFGLVLMLIAASCLISCTTANYEGLCPVYPVAGPKVAAELEKTEAAEFPYFWEWLARINKLRLELELCRK